MPDPIFLVVGGLVLAAVAFLVWRMQRSNKRQDVDVFRALGTDPKAAMARLAPPPVDLSKPITGDAAWGAIRAHAGDAAYRRAVETVRVRY